MSVSTDPGAYGRAWAADYDELYEDRDDPAVLTAFVRARAGTSGRVLEMGVGTGRLALPLAAAGLDVTGIDASPEMLTLLKQRRGTAPIHAIEGDFATVQAPGSYDVVLFAFSTLYLAPSQESQLASLANAARHLSPGGSVVVEGFVPDGSRWTRGQNIVIGDLDADRVTLKVSAHDPVDQVIRMQDITFTGSGISLRPNLLRYIWPAELDAMALACGLRRTERFSDWSGAKFTSSSPSHISVYRPIAAA